MDPTYLDMATLIREVTKNISEVMEKKLVPLNTTLESINNNLDIQFKDSQTQIQVLTELVDDMGNRNRQDNIRIINLHRKK